LEKLDGTRSDVPNDEYMPVLFLSPETRVNCLPFFYEAIRKGRFPITSKERPINKTDLNFLTFKPHIISFDIVADTESKYKIESRVSSHSLQELRNVLYSALEGAVEISENSPENSLT
jgi:hypothetical protein